MGYVENDRCPTDPVWPERSLVTARFILSTRQYNIHQVIKEACADPNFFFLVGGGDTIVWVGLEILVCEFNGFVWPLMYQQGMEAVKNMIKLINLNSCKSSKIVVRIITLRTLPYR